MRGRCHGNGAGVQPINDYAAAHVAGTEMQPDISVPLRREDGMVCVNVCFFYSFSFVFLFFFLHFFLFGFSFFLSFLCVFFYIFLLDLSFPLLLSPVPLFTV